MSHKLVCYRDANYLAFVRTRPCVVTGVEGDEVVAHHVRCLGGGGMGIKPSDYMCLPITAMEHSKLHSVGEKTYWQNHGLDPRELIAMTFLIFLATKAKDIGYPALIEFYASWKANQNDHI